MIHLFHTIILSMIEKQEDKDRFNEWLWEPVRDGDAYSPQTAADERAAFADAM